MKSVHSTTDTASPAPASTETVKASANAGLFLSLALEIIHATRGDPKRADEAAHVIASTIGNSHEALAKALGEVTVFQVEEDEDQTRIMICGVKLHAIKRGTPAERALLKFDALQRAALAVARGET